MEFPYRTELVDEAGYYFDAVVKKIRDKGFRITTIPERKLCKECDLRSHCFREGTIKLKETDL